MHTVTSPQSKRALALLQEVFLFGVVGVVGASIYLLVPQLLVSLTHHREGQWLLAFNVLAFLVALAWSYVANGLITFRIFRLIEAGRWFPFIIINVVGVLIGSALVPLMTLVLRRLFSTVMVMPASQANITALNGSKALAAFLVVCLIYLFSRRMVFYAETTRPELLRSWKGKYPAAIQVAAKQVAIVPAGPTPAQRPRTRTRVRGGRNVLREQVVPLQQHMLYAEGFDMHTEPLLKSRNYGGTRRIGQYDNMEWNV